MRNLLILTTLLVGLGSIAQAEAIERACLRSDREARSRVLCGCIQQAANLTLTRNDQRMAASFYKDPQKAQDMRQSPRRAHELFWGRYRDYAEIAQTFCG